MFMAMVCPSRQSSVCARLIVDKVRNLSSVMVGLDPTIHAPDAAWILGSSPRMTSRVG
nr:hypothetical protein SHINE37_10736 [Rhizobiaceae bacterium]